MTVEVRDERIEARRRRDTAGHGNETTCAVERSGCEFASEQAVPVVGAGQPQRAGLFRRETEAPLIVRAADQEHGAMLAPPRRRNGAPHQSATYPAATPWLVDGKRPEQQGRSARSRADVPDPDRTDDVAIVLGDQRKPVCRAAAFAQPLGGLLQACSTPDAIEQILARIDTAESFVTNCDHDTL